MDNIDKKNFYIVFSPFFLKNFNNAIVPNANILRTTELMMAEAIENIENDFVDGRAECYKLYFSGNKDDYVMVPTLYKYLDYIIVMEGKRLLPKEGEQNILDNLDVEKEFEFEF